MNNSEVTRLFALMLWQEGGIEAILASQFQHPHSEGRDPSPIHREDFMYKGPHKLQNATPKNCI